MNEASQSSPLNHEQQQKHVDVTSRHFTLTLLFVYCVSQFLATLKIMDYSLLVGIHDVERAEQEEMDVEGVGEEEEYENDGMGGGVLTGSFGTPPDSPGNPLNCGGFFGPGEFDPSVDVYAIKSQDGEGRFGRPSDSQRLALNKALAAN